MSLKAACQANRQTSIIIHSIIQVRDLAPETCENHPANKCLAQRMMAV